MEEKIYGMAKPPFKDFNPNNCPIAEEWKAYINTWIIYKEKGERAMQKIDTIHDKLDLIIDNTQYLNILESIGETLKLLNENIKTISFQHKDILRWLLVVVCVIALGRGLLDVGKEALKHVSTTGN